MSKFKVGDKVVKADGEKWVTGEKYKKITSENSLLGYTVNRSFGYWEEEELELYKEDKMEKTFKEVIANIKEGEVWENNKINLVIKLIEGRIYIGDRYDNEVDGFIGQYIPLTLKFELQRKKYSFEEAFKAYKEGRIPESAINGQILDSHSRIDMRIIEGKWYIND